MKISEVAECLRCEIVCGDDLIDRPLISACGADLMSDFLAFAKEGCVLLTGMVNLHVIRAAEMMDVQCIVFVRGKIPTQEICELARKYGMTLMICRYSLYEACGRLYQTGLKPCTKE